MTKQLSLAAILLAASTTVMAATGDADTGAHTDVDTQPGPRMPTADQNDAAADSSANGETEAELGAEGDTPAEDGSQTDLGTDTSGSMSDDVGGAADDITTEGSANTSGGVSTQ